MPHKKIIDLNIWQLNVVVVVIVILFENEAESVRNVSWIIVQSMMVIRFDINPIDLMIARSIWYIHSWIGNKQLQSMMVIPFDINPIDLMSIWYIESWIGNKQLQSMMVIRFDINPIDLIIAQSI